MTGAEWVLAVLAAAIVAYELVAAVTNVYPTITETVATFPLGWVLVLAAIFAWLPVHFTRAWRRRRRRQRR
jgi:hypothetical protein